MSRCTLAPGVTLFHADCREALRSLPSDSIDSVVTDPPYELNFMGKGWDDTGIANDPALWAEVFRVLKPGGHLAAFSASRTYHRMACAIEDAGFEIRDSLMWIYGTGFPKSQNVAKFIDKELGVTGTLGGPRSAAHAAMLDAGVARRGEKHEGWDRPWMNDPEAIAAAQSTYLPGSPAAREFDGFGTALKPAFEPIVLARKPLSEGTVAANVLRWRTGALNIDECRVGTERRTNAPAANKAGGNSYNLSVTGMPQDAEAREVEGRWPANVVTDGSDEVVGMFPSTSPAKAGARGGKNPNPMDWGNERADGHIVKGHSDNGGSAARFFYSAKASKADRAGSKHPTVKPIALMQWLARLITPPGGTVLDPFAGSGTTGAAAVAEGFSVVLCERENEYVADIRRRLGEPRLVIDLDAFRHEIALLPAAAALQSRLANR